MCMSYAFHTPDKLSFILDLMNGETPALSQSQGTEPPALGDSQSLSPQGETCTITCPSTASSRRQR